MGSVALLLFLIVLFFSNVLPQRMGVKAKFQLSPKEDQYLEKQLNLLRKPKTKTIRNGFGEIFDCVDIYRQPALRHPLLKDHKIQLHPSSYPDGTMNDASSIARPYIGLNNRGCPPGTIPIKRTSSEELARAKSLLGVRKYNASYLQNPEPSEGVSVAGVEIKNGKFFGTKADIGSYGIPDILTQQWSRAQFWVIYDMGPMERREVIEVGWMVDPSLNGDTKTRLFIFWTNDNYKAGCFNFLCPGFLQVNPNVSIGAALRPLSTYNGPQYALQLLIFKDQATGNWWLEVGNEPVGYWPASLFIGMAEFASTISWGGSTYNPSSGSSPPMGSGHFAYEGSKKACAFTQIKLVDGNNKLQNPDLHELDGVQNNPQWYTVSSPYYNDNEGCVFFFGGPGGY